MKNQIQFCLPLGLAIALTACEKKAEEPVIIKPPVIEEAQSSVKRALETAKEKTSDLKESTGEAIGKATDHVMSFKDRAFSSIKKTPATPED